MFRPKLTIIRIIFSLQVADNSDAIIYLDAGEMGYIYIYIKSLYPVITLASKIRKCCTLIKQEGKFNTNNDKRLDSAKPLQE